MTNTSDNYDPTEIAKFEALAERWWDPQGESRPLHEINPLRLAYIAERASLQGKRIVDVGCGGGLLCEGLAARGGLVDGIDMAGAALAVARAHAAHSGVDVTYIETTAERLAEQAGGSYDVACCLEMLEHVPDPARVVAACRRLLKPGGHAFFSTLNRNPKAYLLAVVGAEYLLGLLPRGTHDYARFIRPSEREAYGRQAGLELQDISGLQYNPLTRVYSIGDDVDVNYLMHSRDDREA